MLYWHCICTKIYWIHYFFSGKSLLLSLLVDFALTKNLKLQVATPTGLLASQYSLRFPAVSCDTIHSTFHIPVDLTLPAQINWSLALIDMILIDEVSFLFAFYFSADCLQYFYFNFVIQSKLALVLLKPLIFVIGEPDYKK